MDYIKDIKTALAKYNMPKVEVVATDNKSHYMADLIFPGGDKVVIIIPKKYNNLWPIRWERAVVEAIELVK